MNARLMLLIFSCAVAAAETAQTGSERLTPAQNELIDRVIAAQRDVTTVSGILTQRSAPVDAPPAQQGSVFHVEFAVRLPDHYNLVYRKPKDDEWKLRICSDGTTRWDVEQLFNGDQPDVTIQKLEGARAQNDVFRRVTGFFRLDRAALEQEFTLRPEATERGVEVTLTPLKSELASELACVVVALDDKLHTTSVTFDDTHGTRTVVAMEKTAYNQPLPDETFVYNAPRP
jgi:outer membrane lipoprotein-sorting protein